MHSNLSAVYHNYCRVSIKLSFPEFYGRYLLLMSWQSTIISGHCSCIAKSYYSVSPPLSHDDRSFLRLSLFLCVYHVYHFLWITQHQIRFHHCQFHQYQTIRHHFSLRGNRPWKDVVMSPTTLFIMTSQVSTNALTGRQLREVMSANQAPSIRQKRAWQSTDSMNIHRTWYQWRQDLKTTLERISQKLERLSEIVRYNTNLLYENAQKNIYKCSMIFLFIFILAQIIAIYKFTCNMYTF